MRVGSRLFELARGAGARAIFVVGTGKSVGKTTALRAIYDHAWRSRAQIGLVSIGPKPRLWLHPRTTFVTARSFLPPTPASEILKTSSLQSPAGALLFARTSAGAFYELAGPSNASGLRDVVEELSARGDFVLVDGAIDRVAALAGSDGAIVVSCGAAAAKTMSHAVDDVAGLVARLRVPACDAGSDAIEISGALTAIDAARFIAVGETRQIVVRDPTQIAIGGKPLLEALRRLRIRCRRPLRVIAATVCAVAPERSFEPRIFACEVARATGLPVFDVFAGIAA